MVDKKSNKTPFDSTWLKVFDIPGLSAVRAIQRSIDQFKPTGLDSFIDSTKLVSDLMRPVDIPLDQYKVINIAELGFFREFHAADDNLQKVLKQLNFFDPQVTGFDYDNEDDLEATEFELFPEPQIIVPEQKIVLAKHVSHIEKVIANIYKDHSELHHIHHREFEEMMAELLRSKGFEIHLTKQTRDGGTDIIALQDIAGSPMKFLIECKKHAPSRKVGVDIIRGFSHVINTQKANKGIIFTTSYFTADAKKEQQSYMPFLLDLRDQDDVLDWVRMYVE